MANRSARSDAARVDPRVAVLIPCRDEAATIATVVRDFRVALPAATVYVYDNDSTDDTAVRAAAEGAIVKTEPARGKGKVVRRMFAEIDADIYVLVDGDATYDSARAVEMIRSLQRDRLDMVVAVRRPREDGNPAFRPGHVMGNRLLTGTVTALFGRGFTDMLSGYRVLSRRFVKSFPAAAKGFAIETEITVHALQMGMPVGEVPTTYFPRPKESTSKLSTFADGFRIFGMILLLLKDNKPIQFFGLIFLVLASLSTTIAIPLFKTYLLTGLVPRFPTAVLATGMMLLAFLSLACGVILDSVSRGLIMPPFHRTGERFRFGPCGTRGASAT
jgi:glycosyltransferase involved in cell wall biosynthesis